MVVFVIEWVSEMIPIFICCMKRCKAPEGCCLAKINVEK